MVHQLNVFLSYSSGDLERTLDLHQSLGAEGFIHSWIDKEAILPGQDWHEEIIRALGSTDVVVVCLSRSAISKEGFVQKEIRYALDAADEKPEGTIFLIPLKFEECDVPRRLRRWQWVELFESNGYDKLISALRTRAGVLGILTRTGSTPQPGRDEVVEQLLEKTVSNPRYASDLRSLEIGGFAISALVNQETIIIVVGSHLDAELLDRPVGEMIRDEIDRKGAPNPYRRGIVVSDIEWYRNEQLQQQPTISVGGPVANSLTKEIEETALPNHKWVVGRLHGAFIQTPKPRAALWGPYAYESRLSAERYIERPEGLAGFLKLCWM